MTLPLALKLRPTPSSRPLGLCWSTTANWIQSGWLCSGLWRSVRGACGPGDIGADHQEGGGCRLYRRGGCGPHSGGGGASCAKLAAKFGLEAVKAGRPDLGSMLRGMLIINSPCVLHQFTVELERGSLGEEVRSCLKTLSAAVNATASANNNANITDMRQKGN